ncbi:nesp144 [Neophasia sp. alphabaculovirus]|nr:nesp144 [Neophasia sp. alphabaculovirus]
MADSTNKILRLFYRWSSKTGASLENQADLECLYDLERFVGAHMNKQIEASCKKKKQAEEQAEKATLKRVELAADRMAMQAKAAPHCADDGRWCTLSKQQLEDIDRNKEIVDRIYKLQLKQDCLLNNKNAF